jgi:nucleoid-associated protein YgaU
MPQNRLIWVGAAASAVVAAGAGAVVWTHPGFLWRNAAGTQVVASVPAESKPPIVAPAPPAVPRTPPAAAGQESGHAAATANTTLEPAFDVVNVDPSGEAVVAGRAAPNAKVELRDGGKTVAEATADAAGQFVIIPPALAPGDHVLSLAASADKAAQPAISSTVAVSVPAQEAKIAAAAPTNPNGPTPSALGMRILATPAPASGSRVAIQSVDADSAGALIAKGSAEPNATLRLYLNQADVAEAKTQADGRWSLTIERGMTPGSYVMQADEISPGSATVVASASTPFDYPDEAAPTSPTAPIAASQSPAQSSASSPADPVIESVQTKRVATGHTLWALSKSYYGDPTHYPVIYEANRAQIHNPNVIYPGQVFVVPKSDAKP